jgi:hypothetical protein
MGLFLDNNRSDIEMFVVPTVETALAVSQCSINDVCSYTQGASERRNESCLTLSQSGPASLGKTFLYHFDYCPEKDPCAAPCMSHRADIAFEFPRSNFSDPVDQQLSDLFIDLITNFAKTSNPGETVPCGWPEFEPHSQKYLRVAPDTSVRQYLYDYRTMFWLNTFPRHFP